MRILIAVAVCAAGLAAGPWLPWRAWGALFTALFVLSGCLRRVPAPLAAAALFVLGGWRGSACAPFPAGPPGRPYPTTIEGDVAQAPCKLEAVPAWNWAIAWNGARIPATSPFAPRVQEGDRVRVTAVFTPHGYDGTPGDAQRFTRDRASGVLGSLSLAAPSQITVLSPARGARCIARTALGARIDALYPQAQAGLVRGLFLGDRRGIPRAVRERFTTAGTAHILAISGLHVGLIACAVHAAAMRILAALAVRRPHLYAACLAPLAAALYAALAGTPPSALRAALACAAVAAILARGRRPDPLGILGAVAGVILLVSPELLWSTSFQLSFAAVLGILRLGRGPRLPPLVRRLRRRRRLAVFLARAVLTPLGISAAAFAGTLPVAAYHFGAVHPWGIPAAVLACPLVAVALAGGGVALAVAHVWPWVAPLLALPSVAALALITQLNSVVGRMPWHTLALRPLPAAAPVLALLCLVIPRRRAACAAAVLVLVLPWGTILPPPLAAGGLVCRAGRGSLLVWRSPRMDLVCLSGADPRAARRILRALRLDTADVLVCADARHFAPIQARKVLSQETTLQLGPEARIEITVARDGPLAVIISDGGARFAFGVPREARPLPLLVARTAVNAEPCTPRHVIRVRESASPPRDRAAVTCLATQGTVCFDPALTRVTPHMSGPAPPGGAGAATRRTVP